MRCLSNLITVNDFPDFVMLEVDYHKTDMEGCKIKDIEILIRYAKLFDRIE
jgi:hypothetical protein